MAPSKSAKTIGNTAVLAVLSSMIIGSSYASPFHHGDESQQQQGSLSNLRGNNNDVTHNHQAFRQQGSSTTTEPPIVGSSNTFSDGQLCTYLCNSAQSDFTVALSLYNSNTGNVFDNGSCAITYSKGDGNGKYTCCNLPGTVDITNDDHVYLMYSFPQGPPEDECFGKFQVRNNGNEKYQMEKYIHGNKSKCGLTHQEGQVCIEENGHQTGMYDHIHGGTKYCEAGGVSIKEPSGACSGTRGYFCQTPSCS